jgi:hypothetical protein
VADTWIVDATHFLDEDGNLGPTSGPALRLADYFGSIIAMATATGSDVAPVRAVTCRRRPGRKRCPGRIVAEVEVVRDAIEWYCTECGDCGLISGWRGTLWDLTGVTSVH